MTSTQQLAPKKNLFIGLVLLLVASIVLTIILPQANKSKVTFAEKREDATLYSGPQIVSIPTSYNARLLELDVQARQLDRALLSEPTVQEAVNSIVYVYGDPAPALQAFQLVATARGWTQAQIDSWQTAIINIMMGESGFCPNILGGAQVAIPTGCVLAKQGKRQDSGFGQLVKVHYKPGAWLCQQEGMCSKWNIIATPWNSMTAFVALLERSGTQPWCFNSWARRYHRIACNNPGLNV